MANEPQTDDPSPTGGLGGPDAEGPGRRKQSERNAKARKTLKQALIVFVVLIVGSVMFRSGTPTPQMPLSTFQDQLDAGHVVYANVANAPETVELVICGGPFDTDAGQRTEEGCEQPKFDPLNPRDYEPVGTRWKVSYPYRLQSQLSEALLEHQSVVVDASTQPTPGLLYDILRYALPLVLVFGVISFVLSRGGGGGGLGGSITKFRGGQDQAKIVPDTRFADVAGAPEVVSELREIVTYLQHPERFEAVGATPPRGFLLVGPPGTGKTLLARAVAGESGVPFFALSGSDFVEVFAGTGAARVRGLFAAARKAGRAIVFIDEIDAIGRSRGRNSMSGVDSEREQTLNQLLVELDGFDVRDKVFVLAATNRPDTLDTALMRSGRFDRRVEVPPPDRAGREEILALHVKGKPIADGVKLERVAKTTPGFTGADLENLANQAALSAGRAGRRQITDDDFAEAVATVVLGPERRGRVITPKDRHIVAVHEAGHALCALLQPAAADPVQISIVPRGGTGGVTWVPPDDSALTTSTAARAQLVTTLGGRAAEDVVVGDHTQGAHGDFQAATNLARHMVCEWGMDDNLGFISEEDWRYSPTAEFVRTRVQGLLENALGAATALLTEHQSLLETVADALLDQEQLTGEELRDIVTAAGVTIPEPA